MINVNRKVNRIFFIFIKFVIIIYMLKKEEEIIWCMVYVVYIRCGFKDFCMFLLNLYCVISG